MQRKSSKSIGRTSTESVTSGSAESTTSNQSTSSAGGFPCQDISYAGLGAGLDGERSGLFFEAVRVVRELRPRIVVLENVAALLTRGLDRVLGTLAEIGYDAEWHCIPAAAVGAPHERNRLFIIANSNSCFLRASRKTGDKAWPANVHFCRTRITRRLDNWWTVEPEPCSVVYGVSDVVDRLRGLGNAVVPQVAEWIGRRIVEAMT